MQYINFQYREMSKYLRNTIDVERIEYYDKYLNLHKIFKHATIIAKIAS